MAKKGGGGQHLDSSKYDGILASTYGKWQSEQSHEYGILYAHISKQDLPEGTSLRGVETALAIHGYSLEWGNNYSTLYVNECREDGTVIDDRAIARLNKLLGQLHDRYTQTSRSARPSSRPEQNPAASDESERLWHAKMAELHNRKAQRSYRLRSTPSSASNPEDPDPVFYDLAQQPAASSFSFAGKAEENILQESFRERIRKKLTHQRGTTIRLSFNPVEYDDYLQLTVSLQDRKIPYAITRWSEAPRIPSEITLEGKAAIDFRQQFGGKTKGAQR